ncbi:PLP-dependent transferase [uncultured Vagococcus sp.]|uniref:PLP-dependent transferase n=1 Tax=uncultured Vagococcus sp. TaxID=189676 RepID=UPI0028D164EB|nr:PLP-dependent transferase [uncultured Vagococcus sp.]
MKQNTKLLHEYTNTDSCTGASSIPIYQASTYDQRGEIGEREYMYTRFGNPTVKVLEEAIADLENARYGFAFSSGMAAISAAFHSVLKMGDHVVMPKNVYGGAFQCEMSHASVPEKERLSQGITDGLIRFSLGIEDIENLVEDIDQALDSL